MPLDEAEADKNQENPSAKFGSERVYTYDGCARELRQGEILSKVVNYTYNSDTSETEAEDYEYVIVLSQDCDLLWDFEKREAGKASELTSILLYEMATEGETRSRVAGSDIIRRIKGNQEDRYQLLQAITSEEDSLRIGIPMLIIDFKRYFTLRPQELYRQLSKTAKRRCRLNVPYREHLQSRAGFYFSRIGLPSPHNTDG